MSGVVSGTTVRSAAPIQSHATPTGADARTLLQVASSAAEAGMQAGKAVQAPAAPTTISADPDGPKITVGPDGKMTVISPDGSTTIIGPDGKVLTHISNNGHVSQPSDGPMQANPGLDDGGVVALLALNVVIAFFVGRWWGVRRYRKRGAASASPFAAGLSPEMGERIERIEHAVESVAIEVERISEGQRFTTRLMSEMRPPAEAPLRAVGAPEAVAVPASERRS